MVYKICVSDLLNLVWYGIYIYQFSSVAQSCPTLCKPMNCSTPGLPVHHQHTYMYMYIYIYICIHTYNGILLIKRNKILPFTATWMGLEMIILTEVICFYKHPSGHVGQSQARLLTTADLLSEELCWKSLSGLRGSWQAVPEAGRLVPEQTSCVPCHGRRAKAKRAEPRSTLGNASKLDLKTKLPGLTSSCILLIFNHFSLS